MDGLDMSYWLGRKYALMQQGQDTNQYQAQTGRLVGAAAAGLDNVRAAWLPKETAAGIAKTGADTRLVNTQADWLPKTTMADIAHTGAETSQLGVQTQVLRREGLDPITPSAGALGMVLGARPAMQSLFSPVTEIRPGRRLGESDVDYMNRTGWGR